MVVWLRPCFSAQGFSLSTLLRWREVKLVEKSYLKCMVFDIRLFGPGNVWTNLFPSGEKLSMAQMAKNLPAMQEIQEMQVWSLSQEDPMEEEMATHFSILAWKIPWIEKPGRLPSMGLQRVGHDWDCKLIPFWGVLSGFLGFAVRLLLFKFIFPPRDMYPFFWVVNSSLPLEGKWRVNLFRMLGPWATLLEFSLHVSCGKILILARKSLLPLLHRFSRVQLCMTP